MTVVGVGPFITVVPGDIAPPPLTVRIFAVGGTTPIVTLTDVDPKNSSIVDNLDEDDTADFTVPLGSLAPSDLKVGLHEAQIIYRSRCYWMRVVAATVNPKRYTVTFHCVGLENWFTERYLGEAMSNLMGNQMSFEEDLPLHQPHPETPNPNVWLTADFDSNTTAAHLATSRINTDSIDGDWSARLSGTNAAKHAFMYQNALTTFRPGIQLADVKGEKVYMSAWFKILDDGHFVPWIGSPPPGLMFQTHIAGSPTGEGAVAIAPMDPAEQELDVWTRIEIGDSEAIRVPHNVGAVNWFLAAVPGTILWDGVRLTTDPVLDFQNEDISTVCARLARYAQGTASNPPQPTIKTDLFLPPTIDLTGRLVTRTYHLYERSQIYSLFRDYVDSDQGVDMWVNVDCESAVRHLRFGPAKGEARPAAELRWGGDDPNISVEADIEIDGRSGSNATVITSQFTGPAGEYGYENDLSTWGGVLRERVTSAPTDTPVGMLMGLALEDRKRHNNPEVSPSFRASADLILDDADYNLDSGDTVPVVMDAGWFQFTQDVRLGSLQIDPGTDQVTLVPLVTVQRGRNQKAAMGKIITDLRARLTKMEQAKTATQYRPAIVKEVITWSLDFPVVGDESPGDASPNGGVVDHAWARIDTASGTQVSVDVLINGVDRGTIIIPVGATIGYSGKIRLGLFSDEVSLAFRITGIGGDVTRLICQARLT